MSTIKRAGVGALCFVCAAETAAIIAYYGAPVLRLTLAALIGLIIVTGMAAALRAARRGQLTRHHSRIVPAQARQPAHVHHFPAAIDRNETQPAEAPARVIRLNPPRG